MNYPQALLFLALTTLAGCSEPPPEAIIEPVALVTLAPAITANLPIIVHSYGSIEFDPSSKYTLNAEIEARVLALDAAAGDVVGKDQVVAQLVPSSAGGTEVTKARRDAGAAQSAVARVKRLRADGLASDADVEAADTAARDLLEQALSLEARSGTILELRAPIGGIIDAMLAEPGDLIAPGTPLVRLASPEAIQARIGIEVEDLARIQVGAPVQLRSLDNRNSQVEGVIRVLDTRIDPATRMAAALVTVAPGQGFLAGEAVQADTLAGTLVSVVIVPRTSIFKDESGSYVFVAHGDTAALQRVESGLTSGEFTELRTGVSAGDVVVVEGAATLADGMKIRTAAGTSP